MVFLYTFVCHKDFSWVTFFSCFLLLCVTGWRKGDVKTLEMPHQAVGCSWLACSPRIHPHKQLSALLFPSEGHPGTLRTLGSPTHLTSLLHRSWGCFLGEEVWFVTGRGVVARVLVFFTPLKERLAVSEALKRAHAVPHTCQNTLLGRDGVGPGRWGRGTRVEKGGTVPERARGHPCWGQTLLHCEAPSACAWASAAVEKSR